MMGKRRKAAASHKLIHLDDFDRAILEMVQDNNQLTSQEIGAKVGLSPTAVQRRLRKMRDSGVIVADVSMVSARAAGPYVTAIVGISLEREQIHILDSFRRTMLKHPEVLQFYYVTGQVDFIMIVRTASVDAYHEFTQRTFFANTNVKKFETYIVTDIVKFSTRIPMHKGRRD